jgi:hypothetical protein
LKNFCDFFSKNKNKRSKKRSFSRQQKNRPRLIRRR